MTQQEQVNAFYKKMKWEIFPFQTEAAECFLNGYSGIVNAPTGSGKTFSLLIPAMIQAASQSKKSGLKIIWITPIRALAKEILISCNKAIHRKNNSSSRQIFLSPRQKPCMCYSPPKRTMDFLKASPPSL